MIMSRFNGTQLTQETIVATRQHFADIDQACIDEVKSGAVRVNDPASYFAWCEQRAKDGMEGKHDHTLTFLQRAYWIQTGEMIALLPK